MEKRNSMHLHKPHAGLRPHMYVRTQTSHPVLASAHAKRFTLECEASACMLRLRHLHLTCGNPRKWPRQRLKCDQT